MTIPEHIKAARIAKGLTQKQVGEAMGYESDAQGKVARWEAGTRPPPRDKLKPLAKLLGINLEDLLP